MDVLIAFCARLLATAALVIIVARVAERAGPFLASTVLTLPLFAGPTFFILMYAVPPAFVAESSLYAFAGAGPVLVFAAVYIQAVRRFGLSASLVCASVGWLLVALPIRLLPLNDLVACAWCGLGALVAFIARRRLDLHGAPPTARSRWGPLLFRAMVAGAAVAGVSATAGVLGPRTTGFVVAFPLTVSASAWFAYRQYGPEFSAAVLASTQRTLASYACFCLVFAKLAVVLEVSLAFWIALAASASSACLFAILGMGVRVRRRGLHSRE